MKQKFIDGSIRLIQSSRSITDLEEKKLRYGLESFYNSFTKLFVLIFIAFIFDFVLELFLLSIVYSSLRLYGFGIHAKKSWQCWVTTLPIYIGGCCFIKYFEVSMPWFIGVWVVSFILFLLFAPADTPARPLIHKSKRIRAKILSLIILIAYFGLVIFLKNPLLTNSVFYGLLMEDISINPLTYKIFNTRFNNYKTFQRSTV